jgi:zinc protease
MAVERLQRLGARITRFALAALCLLATAAYAMPAIQQWETKSGARVYFVENHDLPMLDLSVEFPAGGAYDPADKSGLARMTNRLLQLGTQDLSEDDMARKLADVGAIISNRFDTDRGGLALRTLSSRREREQALAVFASALQRPQFSPQILDREKVRVEDGIRESDTKPETIAAVTFFRMVFRDHPYGQRLSGEVETVKRLTRDDLERFYAAHYVARHAVVALVGDVSRADAQAIAERLTAGLPAGAEQPPALPVVPPLTSSEARWVAHPAKQSHILIGGPSIRRDDPDYFPLLVGNYVLGGGGFVSRLMDEVRQKRGLAYSAYSTFSALQRKGSFVIGMQTRREQTAEALEVVDRTLRSFLEHGPTAPELAAAKENLAGSFPLRIDSNGKIHDYLALIGFYRLPLTYLDDFVKNVEAVTIADVKAAFARHVDASRLVTVVVGPAKAAPAKVGAVDGALRAQPHAVP